MGIAAVLCIVAGSWPTLLYALLPWQADYVPYTYPHVLVQLQLLLFSALAFAWLKLSGVYPSELRSVNLDADWLYRRLGLRVSVAVTEAFEYGSRVVARPFRENARLLMQRVLGGSLLARSAETGTAALLVGAMLAGYLLIYYVTA
jgi:multicomponent Na+:H+ antiporter subunit D